MASEKSAAFNRALKSNIDKIVIGTLLLILVGMAWYWYQEQSNSLGTESYSGRPAQLDDALAQNPALQQLQNMSPRPEMRNSTATLRLATFNMFDYRTIPTKQQAEQKAATEVAQAEQLIAAGRVEEARPLLRTVVAEVASNIRAHELLDQITTKTETVAPATDAAPVM